MNENKRLPAVDSVLQQIPELIEAHGRQLVTGCVRAELAAAREGLKHGLPLPDETSLLSAIRRRADEAGRANLRAVFNLTGTVLHTNLGRAQLAEEAIAAMVDAARSPCALEYDLATGGRGDRDDLVSGLLAELVDGGSPDIAATIVNNNAAAVLLTLNALAQGKEAVVSRGELVEIGGAFRIPDVMRRAQVQIARSRHDQPHARRITPRRSAPKTALLMKVHTSNYAVYGFTAAVTSNELAEHRPCARPALHRRSRQRHADRPRSATACRTSRRRSEALAAGADIVTFSGDKLLGGPQAGLIVGRKDLIAKIKKNPLKRALRVGKMTLAALEATLRLYRDPDRLAERLPTLRLLTRPAGEIAALAERLQPAAQAAVGTLATVAVATMQQPDRQRRPAGRAAAVGSAGLSPERKKAGQNRC